jgi:hypothetical protein
VQTLRQTNRFPRGINSPLLPLSPSFFLFIFSLYILILFQSFGYYSHQSTTSSLFGPISRYKLVYSRILCSVISTLRLTLIFNFRHQLQIQKSSSIIMPPKKSVDNSSVPADPNKPDEAASWFAFECLRAFDENGVVSCKPSICFFALLKIAY